MRHSLINTPVGAGFQPTHYPNPKPALTPTVAMVTRF